MKCLAIIDPLDNLKPTKDSTLALLTAAQSLDHHCWVATQAQLWVEGGQGYCQANELTITGGIPNIAADKVLPLTHFDIVLMRKDPPFDMAYIYTTYLLSLAEAQGVVIANAPQALRNINEKYVTTQFAAYCPPTLISQNSEQLQRFWQQHRDVIFKPLDGMGGQGIFRIDDSQRNLQSVIETLTTQQQLPIIAQPYLSDIETHGDRRVLVLGNKVVDHVLARYPGQSGRGNLARGATGKVEAITSHEHHVAEHIRDKLLPLGISFIGIDFIGQYVTEINVTSPTCLVEIQHHTQQPLAEDYIHYLMTERISAGGIDKDEGLC